MRFISLLLCMITAPFTSTIVRADEAIERYSLYDLKLKSISGKDVDMSEFRGKVALVVNTASKCGFTPQFEGLEELYESYKDRGFVVLGFPSNDFGEQDPGSNEEIALYCKLNYGVSFPLFEKGPVTGENKQAAYSLLTTKSNKSLQGDPGWNFVKFLVDKEGYPRARFSSMTRPKSGRIKKEIEKLIGE